MTPFEWGMLGSTAAGAVGSLMGGGSSKSAAKQNAYVSRAEFEENQRRYSDMMERMQPFYQSSLSALNRYNDELQNPLGFDPNYGIKQLDSSASARGLYGSTGHLSDIADYATRGDYAAKEAHLNRLASLAGTGPTVTSYMNQPAPSSAGMQNANTQLGNARTSTYLGVGNALANGLNQYSTFKGLQSLQQPSSPGFTYSPTPMPSMGLWGK